MLMDIGGMRGDLTMGHFGELVLSVGKLDNKILNPQDRSHGSTRHLEKGE